MSTLKSSLRSSSRTAELWSDVRRSSPTRVDRFHGYQEWTAPEFRIESGAPLLDVGADGEALRLPPPLVFRSLPGALRIRTR